ncbi:MAG: hypothetical protein BECKG1743D_GA0114223_105367 [Candidatus Kentron sp. G]|nr:MAG: hypothetical protein BECKG1743F_GA0114225_102854 [Candidatus Kentron sp. G]VFN02221.1 MAG: hypothetical protein BECKG1743E_GA0114224_104847 [Candidatus Kentron sp. G]VFN04001.1 MAG: hypothetical protein BECKG1743D_GA0114223_105367 [Candidatus Kentron sp. G]
MLIHKYFVKSRALSLNYGFFPDRNGEFDIRWARHDLLYETKDTVNPGNEREFDELTLGVNCHFTPKVRLTANYIFRDAEAPRDYVAAGFVPASTAAVITDNVEEIIDTIEDRIALQLTWIF